MKKIFSILIIFTLALGIVLVMSLLELGTEYETNDTADFGIIKGNYDNETPNAFVSSFFPNEIEEYFQDVTYHYKAIKGDSYAYEMCLEFVIPDTNEYDTFVQGTTNGTICKPFTFAPEYQEYRIDNLLEIGEQEGGNRRIAPIIHQAQIGLVLFSRSDQRIVFIALGVYDGGGVTTDNLRYFFDRFDINPWQYGSVLR